MNPEIEKTLIFFFLRAVGFQIYCASSRCTCLRIIPPKHLVPASSVKDVDADGPISNKAIPGQE